MQCRLSVLLENHCGSLEWADGGAIAASQSGHTDLQYTYATGTGLTSRDEHLRLPAFLFASSSRGHSGAADELYALAMHRTRAGGAHFAATLHSIVSAFLSDRAAVLALSLPVGPYASRTAEI